MTSVLVVDDEPAVRNVLTICLSQRRFSVHTAANLESALSATVKYQPNVVLLDVKLGAEDGLQFISLLRSVRLEIPCVVFTAHAGPSDGYRAKELGVVKLIEKPSSPDEIADALRRAAAGMAESGSSHSLRPAVNSLPGCSRVPMPTTAPVLSHRMRKAIDYIERHFANANLSAEDVSDHVGVTPEHLSRMFDESLGKGPSTVINELRIRQAQQLLGNYTVAQVLFIAFDQLAEDAWLNQDWEAYAVFQGLALGALYDMSYWWSTTKEEFWSWVIPFNGFGHSDMHEPTVWSYIPGFCKNQ